MLEGVDEPSDPHDEDQQKIGEGGRARRSLSGPDEGYGRPEQRGRPEYEPPGDQPGREIAPLHLGALEISDIRKERTAEQRDRERKQDGVQRVCGASAIGWFDAGRWGRGHIDLHAGPHLDNAPGAQWFPGTRA